MQILLKGGGGVLLLDIRQNLQVSHGLCFIYGFLPTLNALRKSFYIIPVAATRKVTDFIFEEVDDLITINYFSDNYLWIIIFSFVNMCYQSYIY